MRRIRIASVASLPFPEGLWKESCPLRLEHQRIVDETPDGPDRYRLAFERLLVEHGERMPECPYHEPDWALIAGLAVEAVESGASDAARFAADRGAGDATIEWLYWLFADPIFTQDRGRGLGNGFHRVCAMKAAGVERCPIEE